MAIVGVHSGKYTAERDVRRIRDASIRLGATHPVLNDRQFRVWRSYAVRAWPTLVAVDPRGTVVGMQAGEFTADAITPFLERLIAEARAAGSLREAHEPLTPELPSQPPGLLEFPGKVALRGNRIAIADSGHHRVLLGSLDDVGATMRVERIVGAGLPGLDDGVSPTFRNPQGVAFGDEALYVADAGNHAIRAISLETGAVRTLAGTGRQLRRESDRAEGALSSPWDLAFAGSSLYVAMAGVHQIWKLDLVTGHCAPWAGSGAEELHDGSHAEAALAQPMGLSLAGDRLVVADAESSAVRLVDLAGSGSVRTIVGTGLFDFGDVDAAGDAARLQHPQGIAVGADGRWLVCDSYNDSLRWLDHETRTITTWVRGLNEPGGAALSGCAAYVADTNAHRIAVVDLDTAEVRTLTIVS
ncbi:MAG: alkyl hydroperoxide reductase [bacterium]